MDSFFSAIPYWSAGYLLLPVAFIVMMVKYNKTNWLWLPLLIASIFIGIAPFVALVYLGNVLYLEHKSARGGTQTSSGTATTYHPDGSYTVYKADTTKNAPSPARLAFRIVGGLIAGGVVLYGLFIIGIIVLIALSSSPLNGGGGSKTM